MKTYKIFNAKLAGLAIRQGCKLLGTEPNKKKIQFDVFIFEDTAELRKIKDDYCNSINK